MKLAWKKDRKQYFARGAGQRRYEVTYIDGPLGPMFKAIVYEDGTRGSERNLAAHGGGTSKNALERARASCQEWEDKVQSHDSVLAMVGL